MGPYSADTASRIPRGAAFAEGEVEDFDRRIASPLPQKPWKSRSLGVATSQHIASGTIGARFGYG
jgi:hypothetical protein